MEDPFKLGLYVLLLLPGFIFVQVREYYLLREKRSQFEKTLDIILWSAALWMAACTLPLWWPWASSRTAALGEVKAALQNSTAPNWSTAFTSDSAVFFGTVSGWSFVLANAWGIVRKRRIADALIHFLTGRDWYSSVALKFFDKNVERVVVVETTKNRYMGVLHSAPDTKEDPHVILSEPISLPKQGEALREPEPLPMVDWVLVKFDDIVEIQALKPEAAERIPRTRLLRRVMNAFARIFSTRGQEVPRGR